MGIRSVSVWADRIQDHKTSAQCIYAMCFNPNGSRLLVTAGSTVLIYKSQDGTLLQTLKGHKDIVYCLAYCNDGAKFASGSADKTVIVWSENTTALLKYNHNEAIQSICFNGATRMLVSCASSDFAFWMENDKNVPKYKVSFRITCCKWDPTGKYVALGLINGTVSVRNTQGEERYLVNYSDGVSSQIWSLDFAPNPTDGNVLCITDWKRRLILCTLDGTLLGEEQHIGFEALCVEFSRNGDYILCSGCNNACILMTYEGKNIHVVGDVQNSWVWSCAQHPTKPFAVFGCQDGTIAYYHLEMNSAFCYYKGKYARGDRMTDVIISDLLTNDDIKIKCHDLVLQISIYDCYLAVMLPNDIVIYKFSEEKDSKIRHTLVNKFEKLAECKFLLSGTSNIILYQNRFLECLSFSGEKLRKWYVDNDICILKSIGGQPENESLLIGLQDGQVFLLNVQNETMVHVVKLSSAIVGFDFNLSNSTLAVIERDHKLSVFDSRNWKLLFEEVEIRSAAWNTTCENMLCYSSKNSLYVKIDEHLIYQENHSGRVIGAYGSEVFLENESKIFVIELPVSTLLYKCLEYKDYKNAFTIANYGVSREDWVAFATCSLTGGEDGYQLAAKAYSRIKYHGHCDLLRDNRNNTDDGNIQSLLADIYAYDGRFSEASALYRKLGQNKKSLEMFTDLRLFNRAEELVRMEDELTRTNFLLQKANWASEGNDDETAFQMYIKAGQLEKALNIAKNNKWSSALKDISKRADESNTSLLKKIAHCHADLGWRIVRDIISVFVINIALHLLQKGDYKNASEIFGKLGQMDSILKIHIDAKNWSEAFAIVEKYPQYDEILYSSYATYMKDIDQIETIKAYWKAKKIKEAQFIFQQIQQNAISEERFGDASYYYWIMSSQYLIESSKDRDENSTTEQISQFHYHDHYAGLYYAYKKIHKYFMDSFTRYQPIELFNIARFLLNAVTVDKPPGIKLFPLLYTIAKQGYHIGAYKLAREALQSIQSLKISVKYRNMVDSLILRYKCLPYNNNEDLLHMCFRCSTYNPLTVNSSNSCKNCHQPFVFSFVSFDVLPLVQFELENVTDDDFLRIIGSKVNRNFYQKDSTSVSINAHPLANDPFFTSLESYESGTDDFKPVSVNEEMLRLMDPNSVLVIKRRHPLNFLYYKNLMPDLCILSCSYCFKLFHLDDVEMVLIKKGRCPFCKSTTKMDET